MRHHVEGGNGRALRVFHARGWGNGRQASRRAPTFRRLGDGSRGGRRSVVSRAGALMSQRTVISRCRLFGELRGHVCDGTVKRGETSVVGFRDGDAQSRV